MIRRCRGEAGQVGGIEALPFGLLIFVVGALLIANAWAVVDAKFATDGAAREAVRTYVESSDGDRALAEARAAGLASIEAHGRDPGRAVIGPVGEASLVRCQRVTFEAEYEVPALSLPFIGGFGRSTAAKYARDCLGDRRFSERDRHLPSQCPACRTSYPRRSTCFGCRPAPRSTRGGRPHPGTT